MSSQDPLNQPRAISLSSRLAQISTHWSPKLIATLNSTFEVKLAKLSGEFVWHSHPGTDELFLVLSGTLTIKFSEPGREKGLEDVKLTPGSLLVVPSGVRHCPVTEDGGEVAVLLFESAGVLNTGDAGRVEGLTNEVEDFRGRV
jgi:mannose-6-phosphate isomerase-like protein (cupin superfamily)